MASTLVGVMPWLPNSNLKNYEKVECRMKKQVYRDAKIQALWERNQKRDADCMEILAMLGALAALFVATF